MRIFICLIALLIIHILKNQLPIKGQQEAEQPISKIPSLAKGSEQNA